MEWGKNYGTMVGKEFKKKMIVVKYTAIPSRKTRK